MQIDVDKDIFVLYRVCFVEYFISLRLYLLWKIGLHIFFLSTVSDIKQLWI